MNRSTYDGAALSTRVLRHVSEVQQIRGEWMELFYRSCATAFQSPVWLLPWIEVFSPEKLIFIEVRRAGRLVGVAPLLIYRRHSERVLAFAGGGVSDYLDVLVAPECEPQAIFALLETVLNLDENWTVLEFTDLPVHSPLLRVPSLRAETKEHDVCSVLHLPKNQGDLLKVLSKRQRANLRNARSRLERAGDGGALETATRENIYEFLNDLFALHTSCWSERGKAGVLADERIRNFHTTAVPGLLEEGMLHLSRLRLKDCTLAVLYSLFSRDTTFCYLQGFNPEFRQLSPGTQLMFSVITHAIAQGIRHFDFLRGEETYKQHWRAETKATFRIQLSRIDTAGLLESSADRTVAQT